MKSVITTILFFCVTCIAAQEIKWVSLSEAEAQMKKHPKKSLFIDFYTDWCGWCKRMDQSTFLEPEVVKYINENYIPVKFDAESKDDVVFKGKLYKYVKASNGRGVNAFAYFSLKGRMSYPSYAVITPSGDTERILVGFMTKDGLLDGLKATE